MGDPATQLLIQTASTTLRAALSMMEKGTSHNIMGVAQALSDLPATYAQHHVPGEADGVQGPAVNPARLEEVSGLVSCPGQAS